MEPSRLRERRLALGMSQSELGGRLGIPQPTISRWEAGSMPIQHPKLLERGLSHLEQEIAGRKRRAAPRGRGAGGNASGR